MATSTKPQETDFSRDLLGRYVCNGLDEALASTTRVDARPFDMIIVGGGTFGSALAEHIWFRDATHSHRILVLEAGPLILPEHVQNLPVVGVGFSSATTLAKLFQLSAADRDAWRMDVWGLPWDSNLDFPGLAYAIGGRSLFWGGWSPQLLGAEMVAWPPQVVADLTGRYFAEASDQIGVTETNDFIFGDLHQALRQQLFAGIGAVSNALPLASLPDYPAVTASLSVADLERLLGFQQTTGMSQQQLLAMAKLEAPLAVQGRPPHAGFFPFNKFSAAPLLIKAVREAQLDAEAAKTPDVTMPGDDVKKRLMVVPMCHVVRLAFDGQRVTRVLTNLGEVAVPDGGVVVVALGTIESTRLALLSFGTAAPFDRVGRNLMAHLRSNLTIRFPRTALPGLSPAIRELQTSALFVKGRVSHPDGSVGHFHLQITASGLDAVGTNSEAKLFKKVPDLDTLDRLRTTTSTEVVVTIRGIGEMEPQNPANTITLGGVPDEFSLPRAVVAMSPTAKDNALWDAMDRAAADAARVLAGGTNFTVVQNQRDGLGTTHHEAGTLHVGANPASSVTNPDGRLHGVQNVYVVGPALFPTTGSPNPMLTGIALARRMGDLLATQAKPVAAPGFTVLFDGKALKGWRMSTIKNQGSNNNPGHFIIVDGALEAVTGTDIGLLWNTSPLPADFTLRLQWRRWSDFDNSGVVVRFPDPESKGYNNTAFVGVDFGFEVQIDERGAPDGAPLHKTGAIYGQPSQAFSLQPALPIGVWNDYEIRVQGNSYTVLLNGAQVTQFTNTIPGRGLPSAPGAPSFFGLQLHTGRVQFRNIQIQ